jgi:hypothetical protein
LCLFPWQSLLYQKQISYGKLNAFFILEVLPICLFREVKPFIIWFYTPLLDYDVSMHGFVELVIVIPTSPRSSKTESGCSSYGHFCIGIAASFWVAGVSSLRRKVSGLSLAWSLIVTS